MMINAAMKEGRNKNWVSQLIKGWVGGETGSRHANQPLEQVDGPVVWMQVECLHFFRAALTLGVLERPS